MKREVRDAGRVVGAGPGAYVGATLVLVVAGVAAALAAGAPGSETVAGAAAAWTIQAAAIWKLAGVLDGRASAVSVWAAGMGARLAGLAGAWLGGSATALERDALILAYGVTVLVLLLLEAGWLARRNVGRWPTPSGSGGAEAVGGARDRPNAVVDDG